MKNGIDVSIFQSRPDFERVKKDGIEFVMIKAAQGRGSAGGAGFADGDFFYNIKAAYDAGLQVGVYHYLCADTLARAEDEAELFLSTVLPYRDKISLFAAVDVEDTKFLPKNKDLLTRIVNTFCGKVKAAGLRPAVYTNPDWLQSRLGKMDWDLWLALWRDRSILPTKEEYPRLVMWQWGLSQVDGAGTVDTDIYFDTEEEMTKEEKERMEKLEKKVAALEERAAVSINWDAHVKSAGCGEDALEAIKYFKSKGIFNGVDESHYGLSYIELRDLVWLYRAFKELSQ